MEALRYKLQYRLLSFSRRDRRRSRHTDVKPSVYGRSGGCVGRSRHTDRATVRLYCSCTSLGTSTAVPYLKSELVQRTRVGGNITCSIAACRHAHGWLVYLTCGTLYDTLYISRYDISSTTMRRDLPLSCVGEHSLTRSAKKQLHTAALHPPVNVMSVRAVPLLLDHSQVVPIFPAAWLSTSSS